jgi:hypothetical protein
MGKTGPLAKMNILDTLAHCLISKKMLIICTLLLVFWCHPD